MTYVQEFAEKTGLPRKFAARVEQDAQGAFLSVDDPVALARFVAFTKYREQDLNREVLFRGQTRSHHGMVPSLFRGASDAENLRRAQAYVELMSGLDVNLPQTRFRRDNPGAVLQHYGIATPWLDLVDNLYTAIWFASHIHSQIEGASYFSRSVEDHGWIVLVRSQLEPYSEFRAIDLRKHHSSMSVRLHVQHGFSAATQSDLEIAGDFDYSRFVIDRVRVPLTKFSVAGSLATCRTLFPPPSIDESYKLLLNSKINDRLERIECKHRIASGSLGRVLTQRYRGPSSGRRPK